MFDGFELEMIDTGEATIRVRHGGSGPPLLLLHGHPQTHVMWHKVAPRWRGTSPWSHRPARLWRSSKPPTTPDHAPYSKRAMARDQVALMRQLGFERFAVAGHDRGGALRLSHGARSPRAGHASWRCSTSCPTGEAFRRADMAFGLGYWHWFFLAQPYPLPERLIGARPRQLLLPRRSQRSFAPEALADYLRCCPQSRNDPRHVRGLPRRRDVSTTDSTRPTMAPGASPARAGALGRNGAAGAVVRRAGDLARLGGRRRGPRHRQRPLPRRGSARRNVRRAPRLLL